MALILSPDLIAQYLVFMVLLILIKYRSLISDMSDGNIERLIREEKELLQNGLQNDLQPALS